MPRGSYTWEYQTAGKTNNGINQSIIDSTKTKQAKERQCRNLKYSVNKAQSQSAYVKSFKIQGFGFKEGVLVKMGKA